MSATTATTRHRAYPPGMPVGAALYLASDGDNWRGTFGVVLVALLVDLLDDGEPVTVRVTYQDGDTGGYVTVAGPIVSVSDTDVLFTDGTTVDSEAIVAVAVL